MARLIDADELIKSKFSVVKPNVLSPIPDVIEAVAVSDIENAPTVEPKTGKWKCEELLFFCSECGKSAYPSQFCPSCGANMDMGPRIKIKLTEVKEKCEKLLSEETGADMRGDIK